MKRAIVVLAVLGVVGCGGTEGTAEPPPFEIIMPEGCGWVSSAPEPPRVGCDHGGDDPAARCRSLCGGEPFSVDGDSVVCDCPMGM